MSSVSRGFQNVSPKHAFEETVKAFNKQNMHVLVKEDFVEPWFPKYYITKTSVGGADVYQIEKEDTWFGRFKRLFQSSNIDRNELKTLLATVTTVAERFFTPKIEDHIEKFRPSQRGLEDQQVIFSREPKKGTAATIAELPHTSDIPPPPPLPPPPPAISSLIETLEKTVNSRNQHIADLEKRISESQKGAENSETLRGVILRLSTERDQLVQQNQQISSELKSLQSTHLSEIGSREHELKTSRERNAPYLAANMDLKGQLKAREREVTDAQSAVSRAQTEVKQLRSQLDALSTKEGAATKTASELNQEKSKAAKLEGDLDAATKKLGEKEIELTQLSQSMKEMHEKYQSTLQGIAASTSNLQSAQVSSLAMQHATEMEQLSTRYNALAKKDSEQQTQLLQNEKELSTMEKELQSLRTQLTAVQSDREKLLSSKNDELSKTLKGYEESNSQMKTRIDELQRAVHAKKEAELKEVPKAGTSAKGAASATQEPDTKLIDSLKEKTRALDKALWKYSGHKGNMQAFITQRLDLLAQLLDAYTSRDELYEGVSKEGWNKEDEEKFNAARVALEQRITQLSTQYDKTKVSFDEKSVEENRRRLETDVINLTSDVKSAKAFDSLKELEEKEAIFAQKRDAYLALRSKNPDDESTLAARDEYDISYVNLEGARRRFLRNASEL